MFMCSGQEFSHGASINAWQTPARHRRSRMCSSYSWRKYRSVVSAGFGAVWPSPHSEVVFTVAPSSVSVCKSASAPRPSVMRVRISKSCAVPSRHGDTLAATFLGGEGEEIARQVHHASVLVHDNHAAAAHDRAVADQFLVINARVEQGGWNTAAAGAAGLHRLDGAAGRRCRRPFRRRSPRA